MTPALRTAIAELARRLSPDARRGLAASLRRASGPTGLGGSPFEESVLEPLRSSWRDDPQDGEPIATALETAGAAIDEERAASHVNLVLTGPTSGSPVPQIEQTLVGLIDKAEQELLLVTFVAYRAETIVAALRRAIGRGVRVSLVLETEFGDEDVVDLREARRLAPDIIDASTVLVWPLEQRPKSPTGRPARVHAKVAVADRFEALVSSANLTGFAMDINIEAGLAVHGSGIGERLHRYFEQLFAAGVLLSWTFDS